MRKTCGYDQSELADKLDLKRATVSTYERGLNEPSLTTLMKISKLFDVSVDDMLFRPITAEFKFKYRC